MWVCGVPVPRFLSLTADGITTVVDADADADDDGDDETPPTMGVSVDVRHPLLGRLVRYDGALEVLPAAADHDEY